MQKPQKLNHLTLITRIIQIILPALFPTQASAVASSRGYSQIHVIVYAAILPLH